MSDIDLETDCAPIAHKEPSAARIAAALAFADAYAEYENYKDPTPALKADLEHAMGSGDIPEIGRATLALHSAKKSDWNPVWETGHEYMKLLAAEAKGGAE